MLKLFVLLILTLFNYLYSIRTLSSWENLFRINLRKRLNSDLFLERQEIFTSLLHSNKRYPHIFQYNYDCGIICHNYMNNNLEKNDYYSIIDSTHAIVYSKISTVEKLFKNNKNMIIDMVAVLPELKIDKNLDVETICIINKMISITVVFLPYTNRDDLIDLIKFLKLKEKYILYNSFDLESFVLSKENLLTLDINCLEAVNIIQELSERSDVQWIERYYQMKTSLKWANGIVQTGNYNKISIQKANITGKGHIIGIADTGLDYNSCFFSDSNVPVPFNTISNKHRKIITYISYADKNDTAEHGTFVCGCAAGNCQDSKNINSEYNGLAYDAKIAFFDIGIGSKLVLPSNHYTSLYTPLYNAGARVMSMSWGDSSNSYTTSARSIDQFMWDYPDSFILVSAGNDGENGYNTVGSPATNKNGVAVGASLNDETSWNANGRVSTKNAKLNKNSLASFSSRGPTSDGRLKPEICAAGNLITAPDANTNCEVRVDSGTSFSSPILGGASILIRQYFTDGFYPSGFQNKVDSFIPSGSLIKAVLINGGQELTTITDTLTSKKTTWGDFNQGYGRAQLSNVLSFNVQSKTNGLTLFVKGASDSSSKYYVALDQKGKSHQYTFRTVIKPTKPIRITMAYTDYYGTVGSTKILINDLDLSITNGTYTWYPLVTNANEGNKKYDLKNNLEFIYLPLDEIESNTSYTVTVTARTISRTQPYSIVISGEVSEFIYDSSYSNIDSGLSKTARILIIIACVVTFCWTGLIVWIAFLRPTRRKRIQFAKELLKMVEEAVLPDGLIHHDEAEDDNYYGNEDNNNYSKKSNDIDDKSNENLQQQQQQQQIVLSTNNNEKEMELSEAY